MAIPRRNPIGTIASGLSKVPGPVGAVAGAVGGVVNYFDAKGNTKKADESDQRALQSQKQSIALAEERRRMKNSEASNQNALNTAFSTMSSGGLTAGQEASNKVNEQIARTKQGQDFRTENDQISRKLAQRGIGGSTAAIATIAGQSDKEARRRDALTQSLRAAAGEQSQKNVQTGLSGLANLNNVMSNERRYNAGQVNEFDVQGNYDANQAKQFGDAATAGYTSVGQNVGDAVGAATTPPAAQRPVPVGYTRDNQGFAYDAAGNFVPGL